MHNRLPNFDNENYVKISYITTEGWVCGTVAYRFMLMCEERIQAARCSKFITMELSHSAKDCHVLHWHEGFVPFGVAALQGGGALFQRWLRDVVGTMLHHIVHATNMDGRNDPSAEE